MRAVSDSAPDREPQPAAVDGTMLSPNDFYTGLRRTGAHHGHAFAALTRIVRTPGGWTETEIVLPEEATAHRGIVLHPVMLDAALQSLAAAMPPKILSGASDVTYLPVAMESIRVFGEVGRRARCRAELVSVVEEGGDAVGRVTLMDEAGMPTAEVDGVYLRRAAADSATAVVAEAVRRRGEEAPAEAGTPPTGSWLVLTDGPDTEAVTRAFSADLAAPNRRVLVGDLNDETAVQTAFAEAAADPDLPPAGIIVFVGQGPSIGGRSGEDAKAALSYARTGSGRSRRRCGR